MKRKEWVKLALEEGKKAFKKGLCNAPSINNGFMEMIPNVNSVERKAFLLRKAMYRSYLKGWTIENLNNIVV